MTDGETSVRAGRKALDQWWRYPWYDAQSDGVRRVDVSPPPAEKPATEGAGQDYSAFETPLRVAIWTGLALLLGGIAYLLWRAYLGRESAAAGRQRESTAVDADRIESLPFPLRKDRSDLLGAAQQLYQDGNYTQAIIYLFSYQLLHLDRQQIIRLGRGKTNRQYLREVGARGALTQLLEQTMVAFEDVFFGNRRLDRARFEACWSRLDEFQLLAGGEKV